MNLALLLLLPCIVNAGLFSSNLSSAKCDYKHDLRMYLCKNIHEVFPNIFYGNYHLKCEMCNITVFKKETFPFDNNLISMNLTESGIKHIEANAFESLQSLQHIFLQNNHIRNISVRAFYPLRQVYELHLEHNELSDLTPGFADGFEANTIIINHNKLTEIPENVFVGIRGVMTLELSYNKLFTIHVDSFNHLKGLEYLDLQHNKLCSIPLGAFKHLGSLRELNLAHNNFKKFHHGMFSGLPNLTGLNLSHNALIDFDASILLPLMQIGRLDISGNGLNYVDAVSLQENAPTLRTLGISDNLWTCNALMYLVQQVRRFNVEIVENDKYEVLNIRGTACIDKPLDDKIPFGTFYKIAQQLTKNSYSYC